MTDTRPTGASETTAPASLPPGSVEVRPAGAGDGERLQEMCGRQSDDTLRRRFHVPRPVVGPDLCQRLADHDDGDRYAVVATRGGRPVGLGRYDRAGDGQAATAWLLADERAPRPDVDLLLLERLLAEARQHDIRRLTLDVHPLDHELIEALDHLPARTARRLHCGIVTVDVTLD